MMAILDGDFAAAEELAKEGLKLGRLISGDQDEGVYGIQMFRSVASRDGSLRWRQSSRVSLTRIRRESLAARLCADRRRPRF